MIILNDFSTSVKKSLDEIDPYYQNYPGLVICGSHTPNNMEYMINEIKEARENNIPFLGICFGHQLAAIEYARNVLGIKDATSEEFGKGTLVVHKRDAGLKVGLYDGETYWNNYEVTPEFLESWKKPDNFFTTQAHPEYQSRKGEFHPLLIQFLEQCKK